VGDRSSFTAWARGALAGSFLPLDVRAAVRTWHLISTDPAAWKSVGAELASFRTSQVQREASAQVGRSFLRSATACYPDRSDRFPRAEGVEVQFPVVWAAVFRVLDLGVDDMAQTLVFGCLRQWVQVAVRIVPLGQSEAFPALTELLADLGPLATGPDEAQRPLESLAPGLELAGLGMDRLERKYFRS